MDYAKLCVTVAAPTMGELQARRDQVSDADLVELRLDTVDRPDAAGAVAGRRRPVIVTCRPVWEGGFFGGSEEERLRILADAAAAGAEYVDVEWKAIEGLAPVVPPDRLVVSMHDFGGVPEDLAARVDAMSRTGAGTVKVAVMAHRLCDCLSLRGLAARCARPTAVMAMGEAGLVTRVLAARFGSCWAYSADEQAMAPGQMTSARMLNEFSFRRLGPATALYGVVGQPVAHSVSPAMHNAAFDVLGLDAVYLPLAAASFDDFTTFAEAMGLAGASVTAPYKVEAFNLAADCDEDGQRAQSLNTLRRRGGRWEGRNTDMSGFLAPLAGRAGAARATVLGAGGAARSVAAALTGAGARVTISARRTAEAEAVARLSGACAGAWPPEPGSWDILINATSAGTHPHFDQSPLPAEALDGRLVYDLVYNPPCTRLLSDAARRGCDTIGGLDMLVAQAQAQCDWWTGVRPPERAMRDAALTRIHEMNTV